MARAAAGISAAARSGVPSPPNSQKIAERSRRSAGASTSTRPVALASSEPTATPARTRRLASGPRPARARTSAVAPAAPAAAAGPGGQAGNSASEATAAAEAPPATPRT